MSADAAATVVLFDRLYTQEYCQLAASVLFIYDTFVTFDREVANFWTTQRTGASLLFFANKWISIVFYVLTMVGSASFPSDKVSSVTPIVMAEVDWGQRCSSFQMAVLAAQVLQLVPGAVFSTLRAYVLSRSKPLGLLVLALSLAPVGANLVHYNYHLAGAYLPPFGCLQTDDLTAAISLRNRIVIVISRVPLIVADILLIYVTWTRLSNRSAIRLFKRLSLSDILFRDGTIYFVVLFILNVLHLVLSANAIAGNVQGSYMTIFTGPLTAISMSRFLLDLQEANQRIVRLDPDNPSGSSRDPYDAPTSNFISSLGGFINPNLPVQSDAGADDEPDWSVGSRSDGEEGGGAEVSWAGALSSSSA